MGFSLKLTVALLAFSSVGALAQPGTCTIGRSQQGCQTPASSRNSSPSTQDLCIGGTQTTIVNGNQDPPTECVIRTRGSCRYESCRPLTSNDKGYWPPNNGCSGPEVKTTLTMNTKICRYGGPEGRFVSADDAPFPKRSLPKSYEHGRFTCYVLKCDVQVWTCTIAPWFGQPGGGVQHRFDSALSTQECVFPDL